MMNKTRNYGAVFFLLLLMISSGLSAQSSQDADNLYNPSFLGGGAPVTTGLAPFTGLINPASNAGKQRRIFDGSYTGITQGFSSFGHLVNLGYLHPSDWGNFSFTGSFLTDQTAASLGTSGIISAGYSRDIYKQFYLGAALETAIGGTPQGPFGAAASLGFLHLPGTAGPLRNLEWGMSLRGLGLHPYTAPLTLEAGTSFLFLDTKPADLGFQARVSFPTFQSLRGNIGINARFLNNIILQGGFHFDLTAPRSLIPTLGVGFHYTPGEEGGDRIWDKNTLDITSGFGNIAGSYWGYGVGVNLPMGFIDTEGPDIDVDYEDKTYISPNQDGQKDTLIFGVSMDDQRYIKSYTLEILDEEGEVLRQIENKEDRPENQDLKMLFLNVVNRMKTPKAGIPIPEELRWDGTLANGSVAPDGEYSFRIKAVDDNGNQTVTPLFSLVVDNTKPAVTVNPPEGSGKIFSPNSDGNKDSITLNQEGSTEPLWKMEILDARGNTVKTITLENTELETVTWDGTGDSGDILPDGVYRYRVSSVDKAGNTNSKVVDNIIINTQATPIIITVDASYISPNNDGKRDTVTFKPGIPVKTGIESWKLEILNDKGDVLSLADSAEGEDLQVPEKIIYRGLDNQGNPLPEGVYTGRLTMVYQNGNSPEATTPSITVDVTPPRAEVGALDSIFSPNGDNSKDTISFNQDTSEEPLWKGFITPAKDQLEDAVKTFEWVSRGEEVFSWDGRSDAGRLVEDGKYHYYLTSTDRAGNDALFGPVSFTLTTEETEVILTAGHEAFSPNSDGVQDLLPLYIRSTSSVGVKEYNLTIKDEEDQIVRKFTDKARLPEELRWDGLTDDDTRAPDGLYTAELSVLYESGNSNEAVTGPIMLDTESPSALVTLAERIISPNGDGHKDSLAIAQESSEESLWKGQILSSSGELLLEKSWKGRVSDWEWSGKDLSGNQLPAGNYRYTLSSTDSAGNSYDYTSSPITIDIRQTPLFLTKNVSGFSPNGDGYLDTIIFSPVAPDTDGLQSWSFEIIDSGNQTVWYTRGENTLPEEILWEGEAPEGLYKARLSGVYNNGNHPVTETSEFLLDVSAPVADVNLTPTPFSPDNDGREDELTIQLPVEEASSVQEWSFEIKDPEGNPFKVYQGSGLPAEEIIWDGRGDNGETVEAAVDYPYEMILMDDLGNRAAFEGIIPVDILVIKVGNLYKIRIPSIIFLPDSGRMKADDADEGIKNGPTLDRLAEILKKYSSYDIRIVGHAANPWYPNATEANLDYSIDISTRRARTVMEALIARGIPADRLSIDGVGFQKPFVPHDDYDNIWKNRRVEFILER